MLANSLRLRIEKTTAGEVQCWEGEHAMVAAGIEEVRVLLAPLFEVHVFEHDYDRIVPWDGESGNVLLVCVKVDG